jgi:hypothetical protein
LETGGAYGGFRGRFKEIFDQEIFVFRLIENFQVEIRRAGRPGAGRPDFNRIFLGG